MSATKSGDAFVTLNLSTITSPHRIAYFFRGVNKCVIFFPKVSPIFPAFCRKYGTEPKGSFLWGAQNPGLRRGVAEPKDSTAQTLTACGGGVCRTACIPQKQKEPKGSFCFWWRRGVTIDYQVIEHIENVAISGDVPGMATFVYAVFTRMVLLLIQELILQI